MTATLKPVHRKDALVTRLSTLRDERARTLLEIIPSGGGDDADRSTNVDGHIRLSMLDQRIDDVEFQLLTIDEDSLAENGKAVAIGSVVTVDLGDGPESYLFGSVDQAMDDLDVITPGSPLGLALLGAEVGATVSYQTRARKDVTATVLSID